MDGGKHRGRCVTLPLTLVRKQPSCLLLRTLNNHRSSIFSVEGGLEGLPLRATFSPAHPLARRDVPLARARVVQFSIPLFEGVAEAALYCAHRTSTVSPCAFCEQEGHLAAPSPSLQARSFPLRGSAAWSTLDCARRTTVIYLYDPSKLARFPFKGWPGLVPNCARRTTTASSWAFREHGGPTRPPYRLYFHPSLLVPPPNPPKFPPNPPWPVPQYSPF
jgi:hypothetical protein